MPVLNSAQTPHSTPSGRAKPELLAPAGDAACLRAAIDAGVDAVYFGLQNGFNARARAANFTLEDLPNVVDQLHRGRVKGYLTLNTLVFCDELPDFEELVRAVAGSGIDAVLVQDIGAARLIRAICPDLPLHASTQMTLSSAEALAAAQSLGIARVVLPRELSIDDIRLIRQQTAIGLEVFVHGALCLSYSGQCLASLSFGGRSANRGQCAQACRLPYEFVVDGQPIDVDGRRYLLSPNDLAAIDLMPQMLAAGIDAFKIEGRLKSAEYVATVSAAYRRAIDAAWTGEGAAGDESASLQTSFSRGFSHGWLEGNRPHELVSGRSPAHRGVLLGTVAKVAQQQLHARLLVDLRCGDGLAVSLPTTSDDRQGGRVYEIFDSRSGQSMKQATAGMTVAIAFGHGDINMRHVAPGDLLYKTNDTSPTRQPQRAGDRTARMPLDLEVIAAVGEPLRVRASLEGVEEIDVASQSRLEAATRHPLTEEVLREQFGRLGATPFALRRLTARIDAAPMVPLSVLGAMRRELISQLDAAIRPRAWSVNRGPTLPQLRAADANARPDESQDVATMGVLCRSLDQVRWVAATGVGRLIADLGQIEHWSAAAEAAHAAGSTIDLATPRIQKPPEAALFEAMAACRPDGVLVRNLGGLSFFRAAGIVATTDFSLNAANDLSAAWLVAQGARWVTAALDLDRQRLMDWLDRVPLACVEAIVHLHVPLFHSAHCLFCTAFATGDNAAQCARPCRGHSLRLRDRKGAEHPVASDVACRNTVFHQVPQSAAELIPELLKRGVRRFRLELGPETQKDEALALVDVYGRLLRNELTANEALARLRRTLSQGVTSGAWRPSR